MHSATILSASKVLADKFDCLPSGKHPVDYTLSLVDNTTEEELVYNVSGVVTKGEQESITPTTSVPWVIVAGELLRSCGVTGDSAVLRLRTALETVLGTDKALATQLKEQHKSVAKAVERIKDEILSKLPKVPREGKTTHATVAEQIVILKGVETECLTS